MSTTKEANPAPPDPLKALKPVADKAAANRAFSDDLKAVARANAATFSTRQAASLSPMFPIDGDVDVPIELADPEAAARELERLTAEFIREQAQWLQSQYLFFVRCRHGHGIARSGHGIYVRAFDESGLVLGTDWKAGYKPKYEEIYRGEIICQVCFRDTRCEIGLEVTPVKDRKLPEGSFYIRRRHFCKRPLDAGRLAIEGETRVFNVEAASSNFGRDEAHARSSAAGYEVR